MKIKPKFRLKARESRAEERREKKLSPAKYRKMEAGEGVHGYKMGGKVSKRGC